MPEPKPGATVRVVLFGGPQDGAAHTARMPLPAVLTVAGGATYAREGRTTTYVYVKG